MPGIAAPAVAAETGAPGAPGTFVVAGETPGAELAAVASTVPAGEAVVAAEAPEDVSQGLGGDAVAMVAVRVSCCKVHGEENEGDLVFHTL